MATAPKIEQPLPMKYSLLAGAIAGVSEILTMYPLDVVKTRFQIQVGNTEYTSIVDCFRKMIKHEGVGSLYRGIVPPILVEAPKRAIKCEMANAGSVPTSSTRSCTERASGCRLARCCRCSQASLRE